MELYDMGDIAIATCCLMKIESGLLQGLCCIIQNPQKDPLRDYYQSYGNPKAHIPLETGFALVTQHEWNQPKKHEMYMANARILRWDPTQPIFHWLAFEFRVG